MERMGSLDAVFLAAEDAVNHMHIGSVGIFDGPPPSYDEVRALVGSKLQFVPRYRQRVREAPMSIGRPLWIDDVHFSLDYHLRATALPAHADQGSLEQLVGRVMSQPLDRNRPLWEMWVIDRLPGDQWAILSKVHHCMVDGIAGTDLLAVIMDTEPDQAHGLADAWTAAREPSRYDLGRASVRMAVESVGGVASGVAGAARHPARALGRARNIAVGIERVVAPSPRAGASLTGPIGPHRRWTRTRVPLDEIKTVRRAFGGTVNDVVLTAVARGFRELLIARGEPVENRTITTLIPVSLRTSDARGMFDNRVAALYARLPVGIADPIDLLGAVRAHMDTLKRSHEIEASAAIVGIGDFAPPVVAAVLARAIVHSQEIVQTVATNVPGPQFPLYVCGRRMREAYPYVPIAGHIRVGVAIWSYCGEIYFGITGDWDGAPDIEKLAAGIDLAFDDMRGAAAGAAV
jgi:diacylglycerol O-acyltransferase / wax synthase